MSLSDPSNTQKGIDSEALFTEEVIEENYGALIENVESNSLTASLSHISSLSNDPNHGYLLPYRQIVAILIPLYMLVFLTSLDATILSTLMTEIASDLNAMPYISWIATAYLFSTSIVQPLGKLSDIFGRKPALLVCITVFIVGCFQCATAMDVVSFTSGRFLSGFAAGLLSLTSIITSDLIPLRNRGVYQGLTNVFFALGSTVGSTCGGWISERWGWRMTFWCQIPIGIFCFLVIMIFFNLPTLPHEIGNENVKMNEKVKQIDIGGIFLIALNLFIMILMTSVSFKSYSSYIVLVLCLFLGLYTLYKVESAHSFAIIPLHLMSNITVLGSSLANLFGTMFSYVLMFYYPVYLTTVLGIKSDGVGIRLVPSIVSASASSIFSGLYMKWTGKYLTFIRVFNAIGSLGIIYLLIRTRPNTSPTVLEQFTLNLLPTGSYVATLTVSLLSLIAAVPFEYQSSVTSIQYSFRSMGSTLGTSISSYLFTSNLQYCLVTKLAKNKPADVTDAILKKTIKAAFHDANYVRSKDAPTWAVDLMIESYNVSCWNTFVFALVMSFLGLIAISVIKENKLHSSVKR
ncbi:hypothetical protein C6P40_001837 [Pichia californica]|uniref:Major facilitator superfamily (MFS) profile domain-containing protein n=1 Tax=Pichia californica TaxID=460514 RepID=A0A9P6WJ77_9ASCO|nr:hypothetical protein C6P42_001824 [[Candida] californica]KAG0687809.1 hypothetical protein C6P40_001837 [[Candida] californica]